MKKLKVTIEFFINADPDDDQEISEEIRNELDNILLEDSVLDSNYVSIAHDEDEDEE